MKYPLCKENKFSLIYGRPVSCTPMVSIAIPTYKRPDLLAEAIKSVLSQDSPILYELIVVDNDQSKDILNVVSSFPPSKIAVYQNSTNIGLWGNMQRVLDLARGEWILILCDDDLLMPNAIGIFDRVVSSYKDKDIGCLTGGAEIMLAEEIKPVFNTRQERIRFPLAKSWYSERSSLRMEDHMVLLDVPKLCSSFFRREYINRLGGWDAECHGYADLALFLKIQRDKKLFTCMEVFGSFRVHGSNQSHRSRLWRVYPVHSARRLLSCYVDETTLLGAHIREMVERIYTNALWKGHYTTEERTTYTEDLLRLIVRKPSRRFLLRNTWLLDMTRRLYLALRPILGWLSQAILRSRHKQAANTGTREVT